MLRIGETITDEEEEIEQVWHKVSEVAYLYLALKNKNQQQQISSTMSNKLTSKNAAIYFTF